MVAPGCDNEDVGESWVAHQWVRRVSERHQVTLLTYYKRGRTPPSQQLPNTRVIEWPEPRLLGRAERLNSMLKPGYLPFYRSARRWLKQALAEGEHFDLSHQPVPVAMRYPSPAAGLGLPFVIGPVGGSLSEPPGFSGVEDTAAWYVGLRRLDGFRVRHDRLLRRTYENADCVLGIAPYVEEFLGDLTIRRFETMSETGIEALPEPVDRSRRTGPVRLLFVGRLIRTKGARDAIQALGLIRDLPVVLDIVGDGFDRSACEALAAELGVTDRVTFHGWIDHHHIGDFYRQADIFVFPSYREPGGNVAFEAMSWGLPLIVSDRGGPGAVVDDTCGLRLTPVNPDQFAADIAAAIATLTRDRELRTALGAGSRLRVAQIALWESKIDNLERIYQDVLTSSHRRR